MNPRADSPRAAIVSLDARPVLHLSGPKLRMTLEQLLRAAEHLGGVERLVEAVGLRAEILRDNLSDAAGGTLTQSRFGELTQVMSTVRRRAEPLLEVSRWPAIRDAITALLAGADAPGTADQRVFAFEATLTPQLGGKAPRFLRDLASEILHASFPEHYPLMHRWVWDMLPNTGVLREIWHDETGEPKFISIPDSHATFLMLREELAQFLSENGIFRDMIWYVDVLQAQVYAGYVGEQGGAYLKADFSAEDNQLEHTLRILGLDKARERPGPRGKTIETQTPAALTRPN